MDAPAIRPALFEMGERLAEHGYFVLLPDMFWRAGPYEPINVKEVFADEAKRREAFGKLMGSTNPEKQLARRQGLPRLAGQTARGEGRQGRRHRLLHGRGRRDARRRRPSRTGSPPPAGFHGGRLATDAPDSPHLLARRRSRPRC